MSKILAMIFAVFLVANVVGLALRLRAEKGEPASASVAQSASVPDDSSAAASSEAPSSSASESAPESASGYEFPETLDAETFFSDPDAQEVTIYSSATGKSYAAAADTAKTAMGAAGAFSFAREAPRQTLSPEDGVAYLRVACGKLVFYIYKGAGQGVLTVDGESAYYALPSGLYATLNLLLPRD